MHDNHCRYTLRVEPIILDKFGFIAKYKGRSKNKELEQMMIKRIKDFEKENGEITVKMIYEAINK